MKTFISIVIVFCSMFLYSCDLSDDSEAELIVPPAYEEHENVIDEFLWEVPVYESFIRDRREVTCIHPIFHDDKVIFNNYELSGFVALNLKSGEIEWDNRGSTNENYLVTRPTKVGQSLYYVKSSGLRAINCNNGSLEFGLLWPPHNEYLAERIAVHEGILYGAVRSFEDDKLFSKWVYCPVENLEGEWNSFDYSEPSMNNGYEKRVDTPVLSKNEIGETLLIYMCTEANSDWSDVFDSAFAYNIDHKKMEWENKRFTSLAAQYEQPLVEENRIYFQAAWGLFCMDAYTGEILWEVGKEIIKDDLALGAGLAIHEEKLIVCGRERQTFAVDKMSGALIWDLHLADDFEDYYAHGSQLGTLNIYNQRLYYISGWGSLMSISINDGSYRRYHLPKKEILAEYDDLDLFERSFKHHDMIISEEGIVYTSDGLRFLAFEIPDK